MRLLDERVLGRDGDGAGGLGVPARPRLLLAPVLRAGLCALSALDIAAAAATAALYRCTCAVSVATGAVALTSLRSLATPTPGPTPWSRIVPWGVMAGRAFGAAIQSPT